MFCEHPPSVLVVEDDDDVRHIIVSTLREEGFDVCGAASGWRAIGLIEAREFDLMIADIGLPEGLDGLELAQWARSRHPGLKCLFISGWRVATGDDPERDDFVAKPFRSQELLGCVWELLLRRVSSSEHGSDMRQAARSLVAAEIDCRRRRRA